MMYGKESDHMYNDLQKQTMPSPRIPGPIGDHRRDRSERAIQPLETERHTTSRNVVCQQCYAHGHYSLEYRLPYRRWEEVTASFEKLRLTEQAAQHLFQIAVFADQEAESQAELTVQ